MSMNRDLETVPYYLSKKIADLVAQDPDIVNMSIGEPFFGPPMQLEQRFLAYLTEQLQHGHLPNKYAASKGDDRLRQAIATRYGRLYGLGPSADTEILVTHGAAEAVWLSVLSLTNVGDEVLIPDPSYMLYETVVRLLNRVPVKIPSSARAGFVLTAAEIAPHLTPKSKLMFVNSPDNPTGAVYGMADLRAIYELAVAHDFYLVHDEVYDSFLGQKEHNNLLKDGAFPERYVLINSFSKRFSMMGWRLGWMAASARIIEAALKVHTNLTLNLGSFHQYIAGTLLNDPEVEVEVARHAAQIDRQIQQLFEVLESHPLFELSGHRPQGGFFLFPNVSALFEAMPAQYQKTTVTKGEAVATYLLDVHKIAVVPGYIYGPMGHNHVRIVAAIPADELEKACGRFRGIVL